MPPRFAHYLPRDSQRRLHKWVTCNQTRIDCSYCPWLCAFNQYKLTRCVTAFEEDLHQDAIHWWSKRARMSCRDRSNIYARGRNISNQVPLNIVDTTVTLNKAFLTPQVACYRNMQTSEETEWRDTSDEHMPFSVLSIGRPSFPSSGITEPILIRVYLSQFWI